MSKSKNKCNVETVDNSALLWTAVNLLRHGTIKGEMRRSFVHLVARGLRQD